MGVSSGNAVGLDTALQVRMSRVRFPIVSLQFFIDFQPHYANGVDTASSINQYQEHFLGGKGGRYVELTNLPHSCVDCLEIWELQTPGILRACQGLQWDCFTS